MCDKTIKLITDIINKLVTPPSKTIDPFVNMTPDIALFAYTNGPLNLVSLAISYREFYNQTSG